jgi:DNA-binding PadR family transcriptional regulator
MSKPTEGFLGQFEQMTLLAVLQLGNSAYGVQLRQHLESQTARPVSHGALYVTLDRLEAKGLVESQSGRQEQTRGGRPRRYVSVTAAGTKALADARRAMLTLWHGVEEVLDRS